MRRISALKRTKLGVFPAWQPAGMRAYTIPAGAKLLLGDMVVTLMPLMSEPIFGRYVLKLNPVLLLGGLAGVQTMTA